MKRCFMIDIYERTWLLKKSLVFSEVRSDDLLQIAQALLEENYYKNDIIFKANESGDHLYLIAEGKVGISTENNIEKLITTLNKGDCFGEMNLLDGLPRSASAFVLDETVLLSLNKAQLHQLMNSYPEISIGMLKSLSLRVRENNKQYKEI